MTESEEIQKLKGQVELLKDLLEKEINKNRNCCNRWRSGQTYTYPYWNHITVTYQNHPLNNPPLYDSQTSGQSSGQSYGGGCSSYNNNKRQQDL